MLPARTFRRGVSLPEVFDQFQRDFDTIVEQFFEPVLEQGWTLSGVEIWEDEDKVHIVAEVPGMRAEDIEVTLDGNVLTIRGEKKDVRESPSEKSGGKGREIRWHMKSRYYGRFTRQFPLPTSVDESKVSASVKDGLLHVEIEKRPEVKPKRITVKAE
jgi:HSP20 family protein